MVPATLNTLINFYCGTDDGSFPQADKLVLVNVFKDDMAKEIAKCNEDYFGMPYTDSLVAGQRSYGLPDEILNNIKGVEAQIGNNYTEWVWLSELDMNTVRRPTNDSGILDYMAGRRPSYEIFNRSLYIYTDSAIPTVTSGLKLWAIIYPGDIVNLTEATIDMAVDIDQYTPGFPRQFHELLARRVCIAYKNSKDRPKALTEKELKYDIDLQLALNAIKGMNLDRSTVATVPYDTGQNT